MRVAKERKMLCWKLHSLMIGIQSWRKRTTLWAIVKNHRSIREDFRCRWENGTFEFSWLFLRHYHCKLAVKLEPSSLSPQLLLTLVYGVSSTQQKIGGCSFFTYQENLGDWFSHLQKFWIIRVFTIPENLGECSENLEVVTVFQVTRKSGGFVVTINDCILDYLIMMLGNLCENSNSICFQLPRSNYTTSMHSMKRRN